LNHRGATRHSLKALVLMRFCYRFITGRQWLSLFRCTVLTVVLGVTALFTGVFCEVRTKYLKLATKHYFYNHSWTTVVSLWSVNPSKTGNPWKNWEIP
jgi:hypothetical protein